MSYVRFSRTRQINVEIATITVDNSLLVYATVQNTLHVNTI